MEDVVNPGMISKLRKIRHVVMDMDGTICCGDKLYATTTPFFKILASIGITFSFLTNNSSKSAEDIILKLSAMGLNIDKKYLYTSVSFAADYLKTYFTGIKKVFVLGTESMKLELGRLGFDVVSSSPDAVVVGYDTEVSYEKLCRAAYWISRGAVFISTHPDRFCPTNIPEFMAIDCGWFTDLLQRITMKQSIVLGKPSPEMLVYALKKHGLVPGEAAVAGDRYDTDMKMAMNAGAFAVHISPHPSGRPPVPDITVPDTLVFGRILEKYFIN
jgi:NagD protein